MLEHPSGQSAAKPHLTGGRFNDYPKGVGFKPMESQMGDTTKVCHICGTEKPLDQFYYRSESKRYRKECKECYIHMQRFRTLGVGRVKYEEMFAAQKGACGICNSTLNSSRYTKLAIDHCHTTGKVRGLLCGNCNSGLGMFKDSPRRLEAAIRYLHNSSSEDIV